MTTSPTSKLNETGLSTVCDFQQILRETFTYEDGYLVRIKGYQNVGVGKRLTAKDPLGYVTAVVEGKRYRVHRLIWIWHYGEIPQDLVIDHIDQDKANNRIENLRLATRKQNLRNGKSKDDLPRGVSRTPYGYRVQLTADDGKPISRRFKSLAEATQCNRELRATHYGEFA